MSQTFPDNCEHCDKVKAEYVIMLEGNENWMKIDTKKVCSECMTKHYQGLIIEAWSFQEWVNDE